MHLFFRFALWLLHFLYSIHLALLSIRCRYFQSAPRALTATRSKTPSHLALVLASQEPYLCASDAREAFLACTERAVAYCRAVGIRCLSVYDRQGQYRGLDTVESPHYDRRHFIQCIRFRRRTP